MKAHAPILGSTTSPTARIGHPAIWLVGAALILSIATNLSAVAGQDPPEANQVDPLTRYRDSIRQIEEAIAADPENVQLWHSLLTTRSMMTAVETRSSGEAPASDREEAERRARQQTETWIEEWIGANPENPALYLMRTQILEVGEHKTASLRRLVDRFPDHEATVQQLIQDLTYGGLTKDAIAVAEDFLSRNPDSANAYSTLQRLLRDGGDQKRAERLVEDWLAAMPDDFQANTTWLADVMRRGDQSRGLAAARSITARLSGDDKAKWCDRLTRLYQGKLLEEARVCFEETLPELDPESDRFNSTVSSYAATLAESGNWGAFDSLVRELPAADRERAIRVVAMDMIMEQRCEQSVAMLSKLSDIAEAIAPSSHNLQQCVAYETFRELMLQTIRQGGEGDVARMVQALGSHLPPARLEAALLARGGGQQGGKWHYKTLDSLYEGADWYQKRLANLEAWRRGDPGSFGSREALTLADMYFASGDIGSAMSLLEGEAERDGYQGYYELHERLAAAYLMLQRRPEAEAVAHRFLASDTRGASRGHLLLARIALSNAELEAAMQHYENFFSQTPASDWRQAEEYKHLLVSEGDEERLVRFLELEWQGALDQGRRKAGHHDVWLADQLAELGLGDRALALYETRIRAGDQDPDLIRKAARLAEGLEEWDRALAIRRVQLDQSPNDAAAWWQIAKHHLTRGDSETTFDVLDTGFDESDRPSAAMWKLWAEAVIATAENPEEIDIDLLTDAIEVLRIAVNKFDEQYYSKISLHYLLVDLYRNLGARLVRAAGTQTGDDSESRPGSQVISALATAGESQTAQVAASTAARAKLVEADRLNSGSAGRIDVARARELYLEAAATGDPVAVVRIATLLHLGLCGISPDPESAVTLAAGRLETVRRTAEGGDGKAQYVYGLAVLVGVGREATPAAARSWFERSAAGGEDWAMYDLGWMYETGTGVELDPAESVRLYRRAVAEENAKAMLNLGIAYRDGRGVPKDIGIAVEWIERSADRGEPIAAYKLGQMYLRAEGVPENFDKGIRWTLAAAQSGHRAAAGELARAYDIGYWGLERDRSQARRWYEQAAAQGSYEARGWIYAIEHSEY